MNLLLVALTIGQIPVEYEFPNEVKITPKNIVVKYNIAPKWDGGDFKVVGPQPENVNVLFDGVPGNVMSSVEQACNEKFINARRKKVVITFEFAPTQLDIDWKKLALEISPVLLEPENRKRGILIDDLKFLPGVKAVRNQVAKMGQTPGISVTFQENTDHKYVLKAMKLCEKAKVPITILVEKQ